jgi:hypothetical protein
MACLTGPKSEEARASVPQRLRRLICEYRGGACGYTGGVSLYSPALQCGFVRRFSVVYPAKGLKLYG